MSSDELLIEKSEIITEEEFIPSSLKKKTTPYMSQYEYTALILARALQLTSPYGIPLISIKNIDPDPLVIARLEINARLPPLVIRRTLNDNTIEDWCLTDKSNPMEFPRI